MKYPKIETELPGPNAKKILDLDEQYVSPSYTRSYPLVASSGKGAWITDVDGNEFLDFAAGIAVCSTGHCHPRIVEVIKNQVDKLIHMSGTDFYYEAQVSLAKKLNDISPGVLPKKVFFTNSGAEAVEAAFKLSRYSTRRQLTLAFLGAFHGRTMGALSLTGSKAVQRKGFFPLVPGVIHAPYAYCYRCHYNLTYPKCNIECVKWIENVLFNTIAPAEEVGAIFVEPIQGEGGYVVPPQEFHVELSKLAKKYGILYVVDEVQSGMGRTGKMFAINNYVIIPDILVVAKGIASGMPLGAMIAPAEIMNWVPGSHASTFGGNPAACEAALATIDLLEAELIENAAIQGEYLVRGLKELQERYECIGDVRGAGLMIGVEFVKDRETKERDAELRNSIVNEAFGKGLLLLGCGPNSIRFSPPLVVTTEEVDLCLYIFEQSIKKAIRQ